MPRFPRIALTVGDPAGIGPEIVRKAIDDARVREVCDPWREAEFQTAGQRMKSACTRVDNS